MCNVRFNNNNNSERTLVPLGRRQFMRLRKKIDKCVAEAKKKDYILVKARTSGLHFVSCLYKSYLQGFVWIILKYKAIGDRVLRQ